MLAKQPQQKRATKPNLRTAVAAYIWQTHIHIYRHKYKYTKDICMYLCQYIILYINIYVTHIQFQEIFIKYFWLLKMAKMFPAEKLRWIKKFTGHFQLKRNEQKIFVSLFALAFSYVCTAQKGLELSIFLVNFQTKFIMQLQGFIYTCVVIVFACYIVYRFNQF